MRERPLISFRKEEEANILLVSIDKGSVGERDIPILSKPLLKHYMSNIFFYLMPADTEAEKIEKGLVHGWELKIGMELEEAKQFVSELTKTIELCEQRREERHKQGEAEQ